MHAKAGTVARARLAAPAGGRRTTAASTSIVILGVHLSPHAEDGAPNAQGLADAQGAAQGDESEAEDDGDMEDLLGYFIGGG